MKLKDICEVNPKMRMIGDEEQVSFVPMPCVSEDGKIDASVIRTFGEVKKGYTTFAEKDVLFAKITPCMENGKGAIAKGLKNGVGCGSSEFHVLRPVDGIVTSEWLYYLTAWSRFRKEAEKHMTGSAGQRRVPKAYLENYEVHLPSKVIQERQTKILYHLQNIIDHRKNEILRLDELIKARFVEMFGHPDLNEKKWDVYKLGTLCKVSSSRRIHQNELSAEGIPFLRISDLIGRIETGTSESGLFIPITRYNELKDRGMVPKAGDILLTARGTLGRCYIIKSADKFYFQDGMITWLSDFDERITANYLAFLLSVSGFRKQIDSLQAGTTVAYLSISMTQMLNVMLPPLELQDRFTDFIKQVDKSKVAVQKALKETQILFDSLMQKYFG